MMPVGLAAEAVLQLRRENVHDEGEAATIIRVESMGFDFIMDALDHKLKSNESAVVATPCRISNEAQQCRKGRELMNALKKEQLISSSGPLPLQPRSPTTSQVSSFFSDLTSTGHDIHTQNESWYGSATPWLSCYV